MNAVGVELGGHPVIYAPEEVDRENATMFFLRAQEKLSLREAAKAGEAYRDAENATGVVNGHLDRLRLAG